MILHQIQAAAPVLFQNYYYMIAASFPSMLLRVSVIWGYFFILQ